jgi:hypothetical protein
MKRCRKTQIWLKSSRIELHFMKCICWTLVDVLINGQKGRAMAQVVSRRPLTVEARVRSRVSPCGVCGGQSGTGIGFSPSCRFFNSLPLVLHYL